MLSSPTKLTSVTVSGSATAGEPGATPLNLEFTNEGGKVVNASITNGQYSIVLPANHTYSVRFNWMGSPEVLAGYVGSCAEANLTIPPNPASATMSKDWTC
jgi:hypothetical protein